PDTAAAGAEKPNVDEQTTEKPKATAPKTEEPKVEAWQAFVPAQDAGPAPFMIGADSATTVQTRPEPEPQPAGEATMSSEATTALATDAESDADEAADESSESQPQKPALPILMLGMEDCRQAVSGRPDRAPDRRVRGALGGSARVARPTCPAALIAVGAPTDVARV